jgi:hypothetical protein
MRRHEEHTVKYMVMMFGSAEEMTETQNPEWIREMIGFMLSLNTELETSGELVEARGLADGSQAKLVRRTDDGYVVTDGPFAEAKESLVGYWVLDVESEQRLFDICGRIVKYSQVVEVRPSMDAPPEIDG